MVIFTDLFEIGFIFESYMFATNLSGPPYIFDLGKHTKYSSIDYFSNH